MRKIQKKQTEELIRQMEEAHDQIKKNIEKKNFQFAMELLEDCQNAAISLGTLIENIEGEGHPTVFWLEEYCETAYQIHENLADGSEPNANKYYKLLKQKLVKVYNSINSDIKIKIEAVFLPYKASMWDSLESVWQAADADPDCDAYVIPIPYFDKNPDGSFRKMYYEADQYPDYVPITKYDKFDFKQHRPDMIFIHNPYDAANFVTSVHPFFYSDNLQKLTNCLVYIPYYVTSGGMSEAQDLCPAYIYADYIVIQSEKYRKFFDKRLPDSKFLVLGSPKFDSVIHKCQNPAKAPAEWKERIKGRKVYFYNTSINGMLANTEIFLKKMQYVFDIFEGRKDACLLWRPHPLLESTLESMRSEYKPQYLAMKKRFVEKEMGILDETDDIENTIALCDAYVGDSRTSVTSLFGVVGKPLFILNNYINTLPEKDDWRGERIALSLDAWGNDRYQVTVTNQLWFSEKNDYHYKFYMDLGTGYAKGGYYKRAIEIGNKIYVIPANAQNLLIIKDKQIKKIEFEMQIAQAGAFLGCWYTQKYIFIFPYKYPMMIRFNIDTEEICYIDGIREFNVRNVDGEWKAGAIQQYENELFFASPEDNQFLFMNMDTLETRTLSSNSKSNLGIQAVGIDGDYLWLLPFKGMTITCWNPKTGDVIEYSDVPSDFRVVKWPYEYECDERPYRSVVISEMGGKKNIIISPFWGNMFLQLDEETGKLEKWDPPFEIGNRGKNGYYLGGSMGSLSVIVPQRGKPNCRLWDEPKRKLYNININTKEYEEVEIEFDYEDLKEYEPGFMEESEWIQYCLNENAFNSLKDFLDNAITGNQFDAERQIRAFKKINADTSGTCGENVYHFAKGKIL